MALKKKTLTIDKVATKISLMMDVYARLKDNSALEQNRPYTLALATEVLYDMQEQLGKKVFDTNAKSVYSQINIFTKGIVGKTIDKQSTKIGWRHEIPSLKDIELRKKFLLSIK